MPRFKNVQSICQKCVTLPDTQSLTESLTVQSNEQATIVRGLKKILLGRQEGAARPKVTIVDLVTCTSPPTPLTIVRVAESGALDTNSL